MPMFFFDVYDGVAMIDDVGTECADLAAAQNEAVKASGEILCHSHHEFWKGETWTMKVRDEASKVLCEIRFTATTMNQPDHPIPLKA